MSPSASRHLALVLISAALLAFQISLLQILAASQWHHFAYLVISVALLGFGAAGTILSLCRNGLLKTQVKGLPLIIGLCAVTLAGALGAIQSLVGGFDSYLLFVHAGESLRLALSALLLMLPFTCGALAIGIIFIAEAERIGSYYCANMLGSGIGCLLGLIGLATLSPHQLPPVFGLVVAIAAVPLLRGGQRHIKGCVLVCFLAVASLIAQPPQLPMSQYKDLRRALNLPGAAIVQQQPSTFGEIKIVTADVLRSASGLSLNWQQEMKTTAAVFVNGDMVGSLPTGISSDNPQNATTVALPFALRTPERVLALNAGTGQNVALALGQGAIEVTAVEPNRTMLEQMGKVAAKQEQSIYAHDKVTWLTVAPRTWLARNTERFDLVMLPTIGNFGGSAGLFALHEQPLLTRESLRLAWQALSANGFLSMTAWVDYPVRSPVRLLATLVELLEENGADPVKHLVAVRSWGTVTFCIKKSPLTDEEIRKARSFAEHWAFDPALLPDIAVDERQRYNKLQDDTLLKLMDTVFKRPGRTELYHDYPFLVTPTSDNQPFFSQFLRWSRVDVLVDQFGQRTVPFIELGALVAGLAAIILTLLALLLIILPLARLPLETGSRWQTFIYFGGLGLGYMWFELAMIHRFEFYLGQPVYTASLVVAVLLIGSAIGSAISSQFSEGRASRSAFMVLLTLSIYSLLLNPVLQATLQLPFVWRITIAIALLVPAAVFMGMPFPLGLRLLNREHIAGVPWAWGINGCLSVVGAAVATLIAVEAGYNSLLLLAAGAYLLPALSRIRS